MTLSYPEWLILLPALAGLAWLRPGLRLWKPLRVLCLLLVTVILCEPLLRRLGEGMDLWVLMDRSASAAEFVGQNAPEWADLLEKSKPSSKDSLQVIDYAGEVARPDNSEAASLDLNESFTRTGLAIHHALAQVDPKRHSRILLFSDGYSTEPLADALRKLEGMNVPLDFRLSGGADEEDYRITDLQLAARRQVGEPFLLRATLAGTADGRIPLVISRNGQTLIETTVALEGGRGEVQFSDRINRAGAFHYEAVIAPARDAHSGNNRFEAWIEIAGGPRILLATRYEDDPLAAVLEAQGFEVDRITDLGELSGGRLSGARAVILNNVAAYEIPADFLDSLDFFVRQQGGGLLMAGGKQSFGSGGYFESAIDDLLPVSMELKTEHRKLAVAMAIVMDRSGSMGAVVAGGVTKMDLANEGTARAVELLGGHDMVSVFAVDSTPHEIVPPLNVGANRGKIIDRVRRIQSQGGGIYVFNGIEAAWNTIKDIELGQRHIILFSDAADSEQPGRYRALLKEITDGGATLSVIGLGSETDTDAALLKDIADRGNGRIFFTRDAGKLPNIFAQETVTVARSTFITDPIGTSSSGGWLEISSEPFDWLEEADGYNLSYLRENATAALVTTDEYEAPLVAFAQRGLGRTAAVSFPLGGEFSTRVRDWPQLGDFVQTFTRWIMGETIPPGVGIRSAITGTTFSLDLFHTGDWVERLARRPPRCVLAEGTSSRVREVVWERMSPGHYRATTELTPGKAVRGAVQIGGASLPFGPIAVGANPEWTFDSERPAELREVSRLSGGRELLDLSNAWLKPTRPEFTDLRSALLIALLLIALLEFLTTRMGWQWQAPKLRPATAAARTTPGSEAKPESPPAEAKPEPPSTPESPSTRAESRTRFARAKNRRR